MARTQISIKLDSDLLDRIDRLAEAADVTRTLVIEQAIKNDLPEQEAFQKSMESPAMRAIHKQITKPAVLRVLAKLANEEMSDEQLSEILKKTPRQRETGKRRQAKRKASKRRPKAGGGR